MLRRRGQISEALVVFSLTFFAFLLYVIWRYGILDAWWWAGVTVLLLLAAFAALSFRRAVRYNLLAGMTTRFSEKRMNVEYSKSSHEITEQRLATLEEVKVPADVIRCLREMMTSGGGDGRRRGFPDKESFVKELRKQLGPVRAQEFDEVILKYTQTAG